MAAKKKVKKTTMVKKPVAKKKAKARKGKK